MDFVKALTYPFEDNDWLPKLGIAVGIGILMFIPLVNLAVIVLFAGWRYEIAKRVKAGDPTPLPAWDDFGGFLSKGLTLVIGQIVYQIPTILFFCLAGFVFVLPALSGGDSDVAGMLGGVATLVYVCCSCIIALYAIAAGLVYMAGIIRFMDREELGTFFQFGDNIALFRENIGDFGQAILFMILGGLIAGVISGTGIGALVTTPFMNYFGGHILGQLAAKLGGSAMAAVPAV